MNSPQKTNHSKLLPGAVVGLCALLSSVALGAPVVIDTAVNPANGHTYYLLENSNWTDAENAAIGLGGHLTTVNDLDENNWVWNRWGTNRSLWIGLYDPVIGDGGGAQHAANFVWASGGSATYRNWRPGEPNNGNNGEYYAFIYAKATGAWEGQWNDTIDGHNDPNEPLHHGVVELESGFCSPRRATAAAILYNHFVVDAVITDPGCGYTNAPMVLIEGGGGNGATATATILNGQVTAINITDAGCCYTNVPHIVIGSPPFVPTVGIKVKTVEVSQHVVLGWNYLLEGSTNMIDWTPTGPQFTATNETIVTEFDVGITGQYFRIRQVP